MEDAFTVTAVPPKKPVVTLVKPSRGKPGTRVVIEGEHFGNPRGPSYVSFNGAEASQYLTWSESRIVAEVPQGATSGPVTVVTPHGRSNGDHRFELAYPTWYLAEGSCAWGFSTYISIMNPNPVEVTARITYMTPPADDGMGKVIERKVKLPPDSLTTVDPGSDLGWEVDFATRVDCLEGLTIAVDRTMYWTGNGAASPEGHSSCGINLPSRTWYLPEGSSAWGFECWLLIQNPNGRPAHCNITYMVEGGLPRTVKKTVGAYSRATYNMGDEVGAADASIKVDSDIPIIPERSMYRNRRRLGQGSIGSTDPSTDFYLAEGTTAWGFTTYILVQNPNDAPAEVTLTYMTPEGAVTQMPFAMPSNSRKTIRTNDMLPPVDFSTQVHGSLPIIAERSMYWESKSGEACHDSIGLASPHYQFYLPDGQTSGGRETFILVANPNMAPVEVEVCYMRQSGRFLTSIRREIPPHSRTTFNMADQVSSGRASVMVVSRTPGMKILAERSMYWNSRGAGTGTVGGFSD